MLTDLHTHRLPPYPCGIISCSLTGSFNPADLSQHQCWSVGIHPWDYGNEGLQGALLTLEKVAGLPQVVAIGETGIDMNPGRHTAPLYAQLELLRSHALTAEATGKPLILHAVRAHVQIIGLHKELKPVQPWIIHGFRARPTIAGLYLEEGICLSFGAAFNSESLRITPPHMGFAETDESPLSIHRIMELQATVLGIDSGTYARRVASNIGRIIRTP